MSEREELDQFVTIARLGIDAETFIRTPLGRFLEGKARTEEAAALAELVDADPEDAKANRELRNRIHVARMFLTWIGDAIEAGQQAHRQLQEMEGLARSQ